MDLDKRYKIEKTVSEEFKDFDVEAWWNSKWFITKLFLVYGIVLTVVTFILLVIYLLISFVNLQFLTVNIDPLAIRAILVFLFMGTFISLLISPDDKRPKIKL